MRPTVYSESFEPASSDHVEPLGEGDFEMIMQEWREGARVLFLCRTHPENEAFWIFPIAEDTIRTMEREGGGEINPEEAKLMMTSGNCMNTAIIAPMIERFERIERLERLN